MFPTISKVKSGNTTNFSLPEHLTDCDQVSRERKVPVSGLKPPMRCMANTPEHMERMEIRRKEAKAREEEHLKEFETLKCENDNLKVTIADQQAELAYLRAKAFTATPPPAKKAQTRDQEVQATEGDYMEHIEFLREQVGELRVQRKNAEELIREEQNARWILRDASAAQTSAVVTAQYMSAMQTANNV